MAEARARLEAQFKRIAHDKPWFIGTGNDDPIFPWQWQGACFGTVAERWFCGDDVGLGKTRTAVAWLDLIGARKVIVVTEANLISQFAGEVGEIAPHRTVAVLAKRDPDSRKGALAQLLRMEEAIVFVNYEMFRRDKDALNKLLMWQADAIIVDEAHNMKSKRSANFKHVQRLMLSDNCCAECGGLIFGLSTPCGECGHYNPATLMRHHTLTSYLATKSAKRILLMTGTPVLNTPVDLFTLLHLMDPITFRSEVDFKKQFLQMDYHAGKHVFQRNGVDALKPYIEDRYLSRSKTDVGLKLPEQRIHFERVEIDPAEYPLQARTIKQINEFAQVMLSSGATMTLMHLITILLRKRQSVTWPGGIQMKDADGNITFSVGDEVRESAKMDAALERIKEYHDEGRRQIVFSQFQTALAEFEDRINAAGLRAVRFDGSTPGKLREQIKSNFYAAKGEAPLWDVVLVHYRAARSGLNLTAASVTHVLDEEWSAGKRNQAFGRTNRVGQVRTTDVHIYRVPNSVDSFMSSLIHRKEKMADELKQGMTNEELMRSIRKAIVNGEM
jgi:SNF2 family DNA or RNA helicase